MYVNFDFSSQVEELQSKQNISENEIKLMKTEISKLFEEKEKERSEHLKTCDRLKSMIKEKNKMEASFKLDMEQLENDFETVKKHLVGVTMYVQFKFKYGINSSVNFQIHTTLKVLKIT